MLLLYIFSKWYISICKQWLQSKTETNIKINFKKKFLCSKMTEFIFLKIQNLCSEKSFIVMPNVKCKKEQKIYPAPVKRAAKHPFNSARHFSIKVSNSLQLHSKSSRHDV